MTSGCALTARGGSSERHRAALLTRGLLNGPQVLQTLGACCELAPQGRTGNVRTPRPGAIAPQIELVQPRGWAVLISSACMYPAADLSKALALLGLDALPRDPAELSRLEIGRAHV